MQALFLVAIHLRKPPRCGRRQALLVRRLA
jgi:hypothetical protein